MSEQLRKIPEVDNLKTESAFGFLDSALKSKAVILGVMLAGALLRLYQFGYNRSLWVDEAMLALNIVGRSYSGIFRPLDYDQGAPIGFLLLEKAGTFLFGISEFSLRLFPFLSGLLSIVVFWLVAIKLLEKKEATIALVFFALNSFLIYYSAEVKQYSSDVLFFLSLYLFFLPKLESDLSTKAVIFGSVAGALVIWFSHPTVFALIGFGISKAAFELANKKWPNVLKLAAIGFVWLSSGLCFYFFSLKGLASNKSLIDYWGGDFAPAFLFSGSTWKWYLQKAVEIMRNPLGFHGVEILALLCTFVGLVSLFKEGKYRILAVLSPFGFVLLASMAGLYPIGGRLILFGVPILTVFLTHGVFRVGKKKAFISRLLSSVVLAVLLVSASHSAIESTLKPEKEEIKPAMNFIKSKFLAGDIICIPSTCHPAFSFYQRNEAEYSTLLAVTCRSPRKAESETLKCLEQLKQFQNVWLLLSHFTELEKDFFLRYLDGVGKKVDQFAARGSEVHKYRIQN